MSKYKADMTSARSQGAIWALGDVKHLILLLPSAFFEYITAVANQGGANVFATFFEIFPKNRFLSDYVVVGCPKYIFGKFKEIENSEKKSFQNIHFGHF